MHPLRTQRVPGCGHHYNCPIVTFLCGKYKNNVDELSDPSITFRNPFLAFTSEDILTNRLVEEFQDIPAAEVKAAAHKAWEELAAVHTDIQKKGEETLQYLKETGRRGIRSCRPSIPY